MAAAPRSRAKAIRPDYALGAHTASLGLADAADAMPPFGRGMFVGQHGSWNRVPRSGYKVIFLPFADGKPSGMPIDVLTQPRRRGCRVQVLQVGKIQIVP